MAEVALGTMHEVTKADYSLPKTLAKNCESIYGRGKSTPSRIAELGGVKIALGPLARSGIEASALLV